MARCMKSTDDGIEATLRLNLSSLIYSNRAAVRTFLERGRADRC